jgi:hypothetical protein
MAPKCICGIFKEYKGDQSGGSGGGSSKNHEGAKSDRALQVIIWTDISFSSE